MKHEFNVRNKATPLDCLLFSRMLYVVQSSLEYLVEQLLCWSYSLLVTLYLIT